MPSWPAHMLGVINRRGVVMPVIDRRSRLGRGRTDPVSRHVYVVVQQGERGAGMLVEAVQETFTVDREHLPASPAVDDGPEGSLVDGILAIEGRMLSRLVMDALLAGAGPAEGDADNGSTTASLASAA